MKGRVGNTVCKWREFQGLQVCVREVEGLGVSEWGNE